MITHNGSLVFCKACVCETSIDVDEMPDINGEYASQQMRRNSFSLTSYTNSETSAIQLIYGDGDTAVTVADNALDSPLGYCPNGTAGYYTSGQYFVTATGSNTGNEPITIREIGLIARASVSPNNAFLLVRQLVPPRVVQPNETFTYSLTVNFMGAE